MRFAIVGCGPAGLAVSLALSRAGHDVSIYEQFDTPRPVGSGIILQPTGLAVLRQLKLDDAIHRVGQRIDLMHGISMPAGKEVLNVNYSMLGPGYHGLAVHRAALFDVLYDAVCVREIPIVTAANVVDTVIEEGQSFLLDDNKQRHGAFDAVIDTSGAGSQLQHKSLHSSAVRKLTFGALWGAFDWPTSGFAANTLEQRYVKAHTMIGVLPIGRHAAVERDQVAFFWSIKTCDYDSWLSAGLDEWKRQVRSIWPETESILQQIEDPSQMMLAHYGHRTMRQPFGDKIVFLGDAAHSTSPQLGQGANMALLDAWAFADSLRQFGDVDATIQAYAKVRRWHVRAFQLSSLAMTPFYQSDSRVLAALRDLLFDPASKLPVARQIVAGLISGMLAGPPKGLDLSPPSNH